MSTLKEHFEAARLGNRAALGTILETFLDDLLAIADRELTAEFRAKADPSDLVQDVCMAAQRNFDRFRGESGEEFRAWLRQILRNELGTFKRRFRAAGKRSVGREVPLESAATEGRDRFEPADDQEGPGILAMQRERARALRSALQGLPPHYRQVVEGRCFERLPLDAIGLSLGRSPNAARLIWLRALGLLKTTLRDHA